MHLIDPTDPTARDRARMHTVQEDDPAHAPAAWTIVYTRPPRRAPRCVHGHDLTDAANRFPLADGGGHLCIPCVNQHDADRARRRAARRTHTPAHGPVHPHDPTAPVHAPVHAPPAHAVHEPVRAAVHAR